MDCLGITHFEIVRAFEWLPADLPLGTPLDVIIAVLASINHLLFGQVMATTLVTRYICNGLCEQ